MLEIRSNAATTEQRKVEINKRNIIVYKPYVHITKENKDILQFLDLMCCIGDYNEFYDEDKDYLIEMDVYYDEPFNRNLFFDSYSNKK